MTIEHVSTEVTASQLQVDARLGLYAAHADASLSKGMRFEKSCGVLSSSDVDMVGAGAALVRRSSTVELSPNMDTEPLEAPMRR
jgi:hypothetical protein